MNRLITNIVNGSCVNTTHTSVYAPRTKNWIGTAIGVVGSLAGGLLGSSAAKKAQKEMERQRNTEEAWFNRKENEDYADTAAGQNLIRQAKDYAKQNWKKAQGASAVGGGTDAATAMAKESGNKVVSNTLSNMAAQDTARKDNVAEQHLQSQRRYSAQQQAIENQKANNIAQVASGLSNAAMSLDSAFSGGTDGADVAKSVEGSGMHLGELKDVSKTGLSVGVGNNVELPDQIDDSFIKGLSF